MNPQHPNLCLRDLKPKNVLILNATLGFNWGGCIFQYSDPLKYPDALKFPETSVPIMSPMVKCITTRPSSSIIMINQRFYSQQFQVCIEHVIGGIPFWNIVEYTGQWPIMEENRNDGYDLKMMGSKTMLINSSKNKLSIDKPFLTNFEKNYKINGSSKVLVFPPGKKPE